MSRVTEFVKKETILVVSGLLALLSCILVPPSAAYASYVNGRVLILLFSLMTVVAGMQEAGFFHALSGWMIRRVSGVRGIAVSLVTLSFFLSMFLTNDVTLVTVVPFTILVFRDMGEERGNALMMTLIMETVGANLGSMLTPFGNPQNLYLYSRYQFSVKAFLLLMLPYTLISLALVLLGTLFTCGAGTKKKRSNRQSAKNNGENSPLMANKIDTGKFIYFLILFLLCLLSVARILDHRILFVLVLAAVWIKEKKLLTRVDYSLLVTFVFFFVFIGNLGNVTAVRSFLKEIVDGREVLTSVLASQVVSNVPAAILLSGFTENGKALVIGTNLGGLGTLIASMASLITYKFFAEEYGDRRLAYILRFSLVNVVLLLILGLWILVA
uniref:SLC13 family permease n=1 Tax=Eubacterium cellulosolvens TaxID=29322 RepID=UPI0004867DD0|nr:SLC13 family permease [[Eubacterium] cellulosolvens]